MSQEPLPTDASSENSDLLAVRQAKLEELVKRGVNPWGGRCETTHSPAELAESFEEGARVRVAGRISQRRDMGKSQFFDIMDIHGRVQCFLSEKAASAETFGLYVDCLDLGDWVCVEGDTFLTKTNEKSIRVVELTVLSKALRPPPDKFHGVVDREVKYRQRYLDLIANARSREVFVKRSQMVAEIRRFLSDRGFLEVETPMLHSVAGGAAARPFVTHHNALGQDFSLRIAPELHLKRLLVGGFTKVFELNRNFRNEGISRRHNPEFTMLEAYWAYADFRVMADLVEEMVCHLAEKFLGTLIIEHKDSEGQVTRTIDLTRPWRRQSYKELVDGVSPGWFSLTPEARRQRCGELGVEISAQMEDHEVTQQVFEKLVEEKTFSPCYVTHVPTNLVPLAKQNPEDPGVVDVYELIINGQEISPGYTELNDPITQRERLLAQAGEEVHKLDEDFLCALEHGMPPAGGIGVGIDRLIMMLLGTDTIRDVVLFPQLKNKDT